MKIQPKVIIKFTHEDVQDILLGAIPERYKGWWFHIEIAPDGSAIADGAKGRDA